MTAESVPSSSRSMRSRIALGTSGLGRDTVPATAGEDAAVATARALLLSGYAAVDTSNAYAAGRSEAVLGRALYELAGTETVPVITKVDADPATGALDRDRVLRSLDESLRRLGCDRLPLVHLHDPYSVTFAEAAGRGGAIEALVELRERGVVDAIGIAAGPVPLVTRYADTGAFDAILVHNRFTLVDRSAAELFARAAGQGMRVFNAAPFGGGLLAHGSASAAGYAYRPASPALRQWVGALERLCAQYGIGLPAAALHLSLRNPDIHATIVGVSSPARLAALGALADAQVPDGFWERLAGFPAAPTPIADREEDVR